MNVLLSGSEGYIGSVLLGRLLATGHRVTRLDARLFRSCSLTPLASPDDVIIKDIRDVEEKDLTGHDALVHLAGLSNDPLSDLSPDLTRAINHQATVRLAELARKAGVRHFVFSSTCSVYGFQGEEFITEESSLKPLTVYAESKADAERDLNTLAGPDFRLTHLRHGTAYGASPMTRFDLVVNNLVAWASATGRVHLKSEGNAWRPLVHVEDIARSFVAALHDPHLEDPVRIFNIGRTEDNLRVLKLARMISERLQATLEFAAGAEPDHRSYRVNCDKVIQGLPSFQPQWNVPSGIDQVFQLVQQNSLAIDDVEGPRFGRIAHLRHLLESGLVNDSLRWNSRVHV